MTATCRCGARWFGLSISHCSLCHLTFTSVGAFDEHRDRRAGVCRTEAELTERGMAPNARGHWRHPRPDDWAGLQADLDQLERVDPVVAAAAASYDETVARILRDRPGGAA